MSRDVGDHGDRDARAGPFALDADFRFLGDEIGIVALQEDRAEFSLAVGADVMQTVIDNDRECSLFGLRPQRRLPAAHGQDFGARAFVERGRMLIDPVADGAFVGVDEKGGRLPGDAGSAVPATKKTAASSPSCSVLVATIPVASEIERGNLCPPAGILGV